MISLSQNFNSFEELTFLSRFVYFIHDQKYFKFVTHNKSQKREYQVQFTKAI